MCFKKDRVGGRVATFRKGNYVADLGAMVVTGLGEFFQIKSSGEENCGTNVTNLKPDAVSFHDQNNCIFLTVKK